MGPRGKCLVIEDDRDIGDLLRDILTQAGFEVRVETTGTGALAAAAEADFALITLDLGLPDMDGTQITHLLRTRSGAPLLVITARTATSTDDNSGYPRAGYLSKPFRPAQLRTLIDQLLPPGGMPLPGA
ncbi:response regulator transcription factor [Paenarthrobacter sp. NCHU4564]|uniref:response regulator transcription factor n=1 Tax=Paenarthrobacter sp. NCHU4564 TaxID=3451353 RepID=UPI003F9863DD